MKTLEATLVRPNGVTIRDVEILGRRKPNRRWMIVLLLAVAVITAVAGVVVAQLRGAAAVQYVTAPVQRETLVQSVTATGTVNAQNTIAVGTQVSGTISDIDVDYNSRVRKGEVLAKLDPTMLQASVDQSRAQLAQAQAQAQAAEASASGAQAGVGGADATARAAQATAQAADATAKSNAAAVATARSNVTKAQSALALARQTVGRDESLLSQGYIAQSQLDTDRSNLVAAQTALDGAQAGVQQALQQAAASSNQADASAAQQAAQSYAASTARAQAANQAATAVAGGAAITSAQAQVQQAQFNLDRSVISSPVDGTVVARNVSVGQTVAASFQTPTLFTIAQDLNKMEVDLSVGESDIGNVKAGDSVAFTVLAFPNRTFRGIVSQVRINPTTTSNVVTYTTVVLVDNRDGALLPGMTANSQIHIARSDNALVVPAQALSYRPPAGSVSRRRPNGAPRVQPSESGSSSPWGATSSDASAQVNPGSQARLFLQRDGHLVAERVKVLLVSGTQVAVQPEGAAGLREGDLVVTSDSRTAAVRSGNATPGNRNPMSSRMMLGSPPR
jgi:HlyD family secretion protein